VELYRKAEYYEGKRPPRKLTVGFCQRRIEEAEAEIRRQERELEEAHQRDPLGVGSSYQEALRVRIDWQTQKRDYFAVERDALGGVTFSKETVKPGDVIKHRGMVSKVIRANAKTVTIETQFGGSWRVPYAEITEVVA